MIPADACQIFGPDVPQPSPGAPPTRPRDPDVTGGYFQPVTVTIEEATAVALQRIACDLPDVSLTVARAYRAGYQPNQNPTISGLSFSVGGLSIDPSTVPAGAQVTVQASWLAGSAESFVVYDRATSALVTTTEVLTASWYTTDGALDRAAAEVGDPAATSAAIAWTAPESPGSTQILVVLRDGRGGMDAARVTLVVP